jgi:hypothetical protein
MRKTFFLGILKVTGEKSRIRIRIRTEMSRIRSTDENPPENVSSTVGQLQNEASGTVSKHLS